MKKRAIPKVPPDAIGERRAFDDAVKENLEVIIGHRGGGIKVLSLTATNDQIISKINEIIERLQ